MTGRARFLALAGITAVGCYYTVEELQPSGDGGTTKVCTPSCQSDELCVDGTCIKNCGALTDCNGACIDTNQNFAHCGECDKSCTLNEVCNLGECKLDCDNGLTKCEQVCVNTLTDPAHCGGCDTPCQASEDCVSGTCEPSCESQLVTPFTDPWGNVWDGTNRTAATFAEAEADCDTGRARLPIATESLRVRAGTVLPLPSPTATNLWTSLWVDAVTQYVFDFSSGALGEAPVTDSLEYRCMCPAPDTPGFTGGDCNGLLGNECFNVPFSNSTLDNDDRATLEKQAALYECNLLGGRLPSMSELVGAVTLSLPNGTDLPLFIANDMSTSDSATVKFTDSTWGPASGGFTRWDYVDDTPFRCFGYKVQPTPNPISLTDHTYYTSTRTGRKLDEFDRNPALNFDQALDTCWEDGGHLAMSTELIELVLEGADHGSTAWVQTADHTSPPNTLGVKWSGKAARFTYTGSVQSGPKTDARVYRCIYYPLVSTVTKPSTCLGDCGEVTSHGATQWFDLEDRPSVGLGEAVKTCAALGGSVASVRDLLEGFRHGLPAPTTANELHTLEATIGVLVDGGSPGNVLVTLDDVAAPADPNSAAGYPEVTAGATRAYRCRWGNELR